MSQQHIEAAAADLRKRITGEIRLDAATRTLYSTDASIYQVMPLGVVFPRHPDELQAIVETAADYKIPILPRGSGSSLAGQAVNAALVIDFTRHLNRILEFDSEAQTAIVEPGVVLNGFNKEAGKQGLKFGPDPASGDRATFGGMIGNNSTGAHSILFGMAADHLLSLDTYLSDGSPATFQNIPLGAASRLAESDRLTARLVAAALEVRERYAETIKKNWPRVWRRASGYSLNYLMGWSSTQPPQWQGIQGEFQYPPGGADHINLAALMAGSEGTLSIFRSATINLVSQPRQSVLAVLPYNSVAASGDAAPALLEHHPSAIELIPRALIERARAIPAYAARLGFLQGKDPEAVLLVEFSGADHTELMKKARALGSDIVIADTKEMQDQIWSVRKVGLGLLMSIKGDKKPLPFVEDVAVPVEQLGDYIRGFERIMAEYGTHGDFYAHASAGCLHIRPLLNLKTQPGIEAMREMTRAVAQLTLDVGGALSGEHGDGRARSEWLEMVYGLEIIAAFKYIKHAADPYNLLNPGNIVDPHPMDASLRFGADYQADLWQPVLDFSKQENLQGAIEMCNGAGICRQADGLMCPTFHATSEEMHATRGRANLLRNMINNRGFSGKLAEQAAFEALDLCLECKACKAECPSAVDMAKLKYEFLNFYYQGRGRPVKDYVFGFIDVFARIGQPIAPLANLVVQNPLSAWVADRFVGISKQRHLPRLASRRFSAKESDTSTGERVLFLADPFTEFFYPQLGHAALDVLHRAGCQVTVLPVIGAGRTRISKGFLPQAKVHAQKVLAAIKDLDPAGEFPVVGIEPSELTTLRDEYPDLFPGNSSVTALAQRTWLLDEFLLRPGSDGVPRIASLGQTGAGQSVLLHGHCYQKAQSPSADGYPSGVEASVAILKAVGYQVELIQSGCCGMAGSFGYERDHVEVSLAVGELAVFPQVRASQADIIAAIGVSCRSQIESGTDRETVHPVTLL